MLDVIKVLMQDNYTLLSPKKRLTLEPRTVGLGGTTRVDSEFDIFIRLNDLLP